MKAENVKEMEGYIVHRLQQMDMFKEVPEDQLRWFASVSNLCIYQPDEVYFKPGDEITNMAIIFEGNLKLRYKRGNQWLDMGEFTGGEITGKLPFSRVQTPAAFIIAVEETTILETPISIYPELVKRYELVSPLVHTLLDRVRSFTSREEQNDKLMALGKLSAGLAHELNNPASAMVRSATSLRANLRNKPEKFKAVMNVQVTNEEVDAINELVFKKAEHGTSNNMTLMERTVMEDELADWLEDHGLEDPYEAAETFAEFCLEIDDLEFVKENVREETLISVLGWVEDVLNTEKMVEEIEEAASRISDLVSSIKTYSHMDRGTDKEPVEIKKLLKSTLTMLNHKSKLKNVEISVTVEPNMPEFCGYVSELNQVWTNLLDNAIDAVEDGGKIEVEARQNKDKLNMFFRDNGSGVPEEIQNKIFDPFFTTKDVGKGTGLGLDVVRKIIQKHDGQIELTSKPGETEFKLVFPFNS